jgi:hypothetical protein
MIISVGYRISSKKATVFRRWATTTLRQHLIGGYCALVMNMLDAGESE